MAGFTSDWLALREPADQAARSRDLTAAIAAMCAPRAGIHVLDLGAGTGANLRYLSPYLPARQHWLLVDHDRALLARAASMAFPWGQPVTRCVDLRTLDDAAMFDGRDLVTASALLDLVSAAWMRLLARRCRDRWAMALFPLIYDGRMECEPTDDADARVRDLVNRHQATDKGFGPALGPAASDAAAEAFAAAGYRVRVDRSDWVLDAPDALLQQQLVDGWAAAASEIAPADAAAIEGWRRRRLGHISAGRTRIRVGHQDVAAWQG